MSPYDQLWAESPVMNARSITDTVLGKMAAGVPGIQGEGRSMGIQNATCGC